MVTNMNIHKRFIVQFFIQIILAFFLLSLILIIMWAIIGFSIMNSDVAKDLSKADELFFIDKISIKDEKVTFDKKLKKMVKNQNGQLIVLTEKGAVIGSYNTAEKVPAHMNESEVASLILGTPAEYSYWKLEEGYKRPYILLFGKKIPAQT